MERKSEDEITVHCKALGNPNVMIMWYPTVVYNVEGVSSIGGIVNQGNSLASVNVSTCLSKASRISCIATATIDNTVIATATANLTLCGMCFYLFVLQLIFSNTAVLFFFMSLGLFISDVLEEPIFYFNLKVYVSHKQKLRY